VRPAESVTHISASLHTNLSLTQSRKREAERRSHQTNSITLFEVANHPPIAGGSFALKVITKRSSRPHQISRSQPDLHSLLNANTHKTKWNSRKWNDFPSDGRGPQSYWYIDRFVLRAHTQKKRRQHPICIRRSPAMQFAVMLTAAAGGRLSCQKWLFTAGNLGQTMAADFTSSSNDAWWLNYTRATEVCCWKMNVHLAALKFSKYRTQILH